jgi:A/G-specific adenine glycosylase
MRSMSSPQLPTLASLVVEWAKTNLRDLPWRRSRDPWAVLVAEMMLQQTQVSRVADRHARFLRRFPDPASCAAGQPAELLREWEGLGYNRRALMLHRASVEITARHGGSVPRSLEALLALPGIGPYTARAVRAFAFEDEAAPVDTNIGRVLARQVGRTLAPREAQVLADALVPVDDVWLYNQGVMELGAVVCTKRTPSCVTCPVADICKWRGRGADPATGSAGVSRPQTKFEGSDRQLRGRLINSLRRAPIPVVAVGAAISCGDDERQARVVAGLVDDGLIEIEDGVARLAGDPATPVR